MTVKPLLHALAPPAAVRLAHYRMPAGDVIVGVLTPDADETDAPADDDALACGDPGAHRLTWNAILDLLEQADCTPTEIADRLGKASGFVRRLLREMAALDRPLAKCVQESVRNRPAIWRRTQHAR